MPRLGDDPITEADDDRLVRRTLDGDRQAFGVLIERYSGRVIAICARVAGDEYEDAQDVAQDVFLRAYLNLEKYQPGRSFFAWLYRIAVNLALTGAPAARRRRSGAPPPSGRSSNSRTRTRWGPRKRVWSAPNGRACCRRPWPACRPTTRRCWPCATARISTIARSRRRWKCRSAPSRRGCTGRRRCYGPSWRHYTRKEQRHETCASGRARRGDPRRLAGWRRRGLAR